MIMRHLPRLGGQIGVFVAFFAGWELLVDLPSHQAGDLAGAKPDFRYHGHALVLFA